MQQYLDLLNRVMTKGIRKMDRTGTGTISIFGHQSRYNLQDGFPCLTTKKLHLRSIIIELLWFLRGETNIKWLNENGVKIWDEWADAQGELGPVYGYQWRSWPSPAIFEPTADFATGKKCDDEGEYLPGPSIDQISNVIARIKSKPDDRRLIVSAWNPAQIDQMKLPPCHCLFQFYTRELSFADRSSRSKKKSTFRGTIEYGNALRGDAEAIAAFHAQFDAEGVPRRYLDCQLYQRSCDSFLGIPFNIASYALLTMMVAQVCDMLPGEFIWTGGDVHVYSNHFDQVNLQLSRDCRPLPTMKINPDVKDIFSFKYEDFTLEGYDPHPHIAGAVSV